MIVAFIGVKLIMRALNDNTLPFINGGEHVEWVPEVPIWLSLAVTIGTLVVATVASLARTRREGRPLPAAQRKQLRPEDVGGEVREPR